MVYFWESFLGESRSETEDDFKWSVCEYCGHKDVSIRKRWTFFMIFYMKKNTSV